MTLPPARRALTGLLLCGTVALALGAAACARRPATAGATSVAAGTVSALEATDVMPGSGAVASPGVRVTVQYTGWLYDRGRPEQKGEKFDSSLDSGRPFQFVLGAGQVIAGWDQGVQGMKVGGRRRLVIPAALAYGNDGAGGVIPPGASLVFDIELLAVDAPEPSRAATTSRTD